MRCAVQTKAADSQKLKVKAPEVPRKEESKPDCSGLLIRGSAGPGGEIEGALEGGASVDGFAVGDDDALERKI
jgi:hypothetical protein